MRYHKGTTNNRLQQQKDHDDGHDHKMQNQEGNASSS